MWGEIANRAKAVAKLVDRLNREFGAEVLLFCYEAGPCGYGRPGYSRVRGCRSPSSVAAVELVEAVG
jgi:hypothetical protein